MKRLGKFFDFAFFGFLFSAILLLVSGCWEKDKTATDIAKIPIDLSVYRFDVEFANTTPDKLHDLKSKYPYLFPEQYHDSIWIAKLTDTIQVELLNEVAKEFGDFERESEALGSLFQHIVYYFPKFEVPKVVTVTSNVRYRDRVLLADSLLLLGLDNYLGQDHHFYESIQRYIAQGLDKQYLTADVAGAFAKQVVKPSTERSFLSRMIYYGKELYVKDKLLPQITDAQKIGYTEDQMIWARDNEEMIWRYFIEKELLYSTDAKLDSRFLDLSPFSKFGLELDSESPGRLGRYMGWQIIRAFMQKNRLTLQQMLTMPADEIFKKSNYKPEK